MVEPVSLEKLRRIDAYWRAANYLSVGQIYLYNNPLLKEPLAPQHIHQACRDKLIEHRQYIYRYGEDMPEFRDWKWKS